MKTTTYDASRHRGIFPLVALIGFYTVAAILPLLPNHLPPPLIVGAQIIPPTLFALIHGSQAYGWRGVFTFTAICFVVGNMVENIGVATRFPFGNYYFTDVMGPKLFHVPLLMGPAYLAIGYSSWSMAHLILQRAGKSLIGPNVLAVPMLATWIMVIWDLCTEPVWSTISRFWVWPQGGPYFGVPVSNFLGWFVANYLIFQLFAIYVSKQSPVIGSIPQIHGRLAVLAYTVVVLANIVNSLALFRLPPVFDPTGIEWKSRSIGLTSALVSVFFMGAFAVLGWMKVSRQGSGEAGQAPAMLRERTSAK
jgi:putative membrane protein